MTEPTLHLVLYCPEIPPNTGNVGRLSVAVGARLHLVHPLGFSLEEKAVRRAGLDYWRHVDLVEHPDADAFWSWCEGRRVHLFSTRGGAPYTRCAYAPADVLVFGPETVGLPRSQVESRGAYHIPMWAGPIRSLNLANAVAIVAYEALRQTRPGRFV